MSGNRISVSELDFTGIKQNFINYLKDQEQYKDYNFTGSNISVLLDILAYNTHYNNLYNNFILNELFLDTATLRNSIVSHAKTIGYTPRSAVAGKAKVNVVVSGTSTPRADILVLPRGSEFTATLDQVTYTYTTNQSYTAQLVDGIYTFVGVELIQGVLLTNSYDVWDGGRYIIPNVGCDISTVTVKVQKSLQNSSIEVYSRIEDITESTGDSQVFYIKEIENELYEVYFGQNIIGLQPENGSLLTLEYFVTSGEITNGLKNFTYAGQSLAGGVVTTQTVESSSSSKNLEEIESIRVNAPNFFSSQNRAVIDKDYSTLIYKEMPNIDSISVWGGEDNIPVQYGKVFISVKPTGKNFLSEAEKTKILSMLKKKRMQGITPELVNPESLQIVLDVNVHYDEVKSNKAKNQIELIVSEVISKYNTREMNKFESNFKYSPFTTLVDQADFSITNSITKVKLKKLFTPTFSAINNYVVNIYNPFITFRSSSFYIPGYEDSVYLISEGDTISVRDTLTGEVVISTIGRVDRKKGIIYLNQLTVSSTVSGTDLYFEISPESYDISSALNMIASIDLVDSTVTAIPSSSTITIPIR